MNKATTTERNAKNTQQTEPIKNISRTAGNRYDKLDKDLYMIYPTRREERTECFYFRNKILEPEDERKEIDYDGIDIKDCIKKVGQVIKAHQAKIDREKSLFD